MAKIELKNIPTNQIVANPEQPRETFEKDEIKKLAESILSNGLINEIIVRKKGRKYEIVAGERRWRAHQIANIKTIPVKVKEYKNDFWAGVESSIENYQREDVTSAEKEKDIFRNWERGLKFKEIKTYKDLGKIMGLDENTISKIISAKEFRENKNLGPRISTSVISETSGLKEEDRVKLVKYAEKKEIGGRTLRALSKAVKQSTSEVKDALLDNKITVDQAERISKLKSEPERRKAIQEHQSLAVVEKAVEKNVEIQMTAREKRELDKKLLQAGNWIASFRGSVSDTHKQIERTIKILLVSTKFIPAMDGTQLKKLNNELEDFIEILEKGEQLATQIQEKIE